MATPEIRVGPVAPVPASPSRALVRVTPVAPQAVPDHPGAPLGRSGLDLRDLFATTDSVAVRSPTPAVALEMGLEQARGSLVRNQPAHALAKLDKVWNGARHTETGWYLRGSSLALLGLPAEASRVAADGVSRNPNSAANHFLQSLAKLTLGDFAAAQASLANAKANHEPNALLFTQEALLEAARGDMSGAERLLTLAAARWPNHPALAYGRDVIWQLVNERARSAQHTPGEEVGAPDGRPGGRTPGGVPVLDQPGNSARTDRNRAWDVASDALRGLAAKLVSGTKPEALADARALLISLSAGGTTAPALAPARAHAMRALVGAIIEALQGGTDARRIGWIAERVDGGWRRAEAGPELGLSSSASTVMPEPDALQTAVRITVAALANGRLGEAEAQLKRLNGSLGDTALGLLHGFVGAARGFAEGTTSAVAASELPLPEADGRPGVPLHVHAAEVTNVLLAPLRLGLGLLPEPLHAPDVLIRTDRDIGIAAGYAAVLSSALPTDFDRYRTRQVWGGLPALGGAVVLVALSVLAFSVSERLLGAALASAAGWLALRGVSARPREPRH